MLTLTRFYDKSIVILISYSVILILRFVFHNVDRNNKSTEALFL